MNKKIKLNIKLNEHVEFCQYKLEVRITLKVTRSKNNTKGNLK